MKTLFNSLKPEAKRKFDACKDEFPATYSAMLIALSKNSVANLTISEAQMLTLYLGNHVGLDGLYNLFI